MTGAIAMDKVILFLHGWSRHVRRECTGQLVLRVDESPAMKGQQKETQAKQQQKQNKPPKKERKQRHGR